MAKAKQEHKLDIKIVNLADLPSDWSHRFNARVPSRGHKGYRDMLRQLETAPENFLAQNNGIYVADRDLLNGSHTYLVAQDAKGLGIDLTKAFVKVTYYNGLSDEEKKTISRFLNNQTTPPERGVRALKGDWDLILQNLSPKYRDLVEVRPNEKPGTKYKIEFVVSLLYAWVSDTAERAYAARGQVSRYFNPEKHKAVVRKVDEAIELYSQIAKDLAARKDIQKLNGVDTTRKFTLPNGEICNVYIPIPYILPVFAAFGQYLTADGEWKNGANPLNIWKRRKDQMVARLLKSYKDNRSDPTNLGKSKDAYLQQKMALMTVVS